MNQPKALGGIAPYGYRWQNGELVVDKKESPVRRLIFELFIKHKRKKTVARLLNDLGYRTRTASQFSDTTIDRLLRDTTAKGVRTIGNRNVEVEPIVSEAIWDRANSLLGKGREPKQSIHLFSGKLLCACGGKMFVPSNTAKYVCTECRHKILCDDIEAIFRSQLKAWPGADFQRLQELWDYFTTKEKRLLVEQLTKRIVIESDAITIRFVFGHYSHPNKTMTNGQQNSKGNETPHQVTEFSNLNGNSETLNEMDAASFLGISMSTLIRKRNAGEIGYFRVGRRIVYSAEDHLIPFLKNRESGPRKILANR